MMKKVPIEAIEKLLEAKQLEKEAMKLLMSDKMQGHLAVIKKEVTGMLLDLLVESAEKQETQATSQVRNVTID